MYEGHAESLGQRPIKKKLQVVSITKFAPMYFSLFETYW